MQAATATATATETEKSDCGLLAKDSVTRSSALPHSLLHSVSLSLWLCEARADLKLSADNCNLSVGGACSSIELLLLLLLLLL